MAGKRVLRILRTCPPYNAGELCTPPDHEARKFLIMGAAEVVNPPREELVPTEEAAADVEAAPEVELPAQEEDAGEDDVGAVILPEAPTEDSEMDTRHAEKATLDHPDASFETLDDIRAELDERGIKYDKRWGRQRLLDLIA